MKALLAAAALLWITGAQAQQLPEASDPVFLTRAMTAIKSQREAALDAAAFHQAKAASLAEALEKAKARIVELEIEAKLPPKPESEKPK